MKHNPALIRLLEMRLIVFFKCVTACLVCSVFGLLAQSSELGEPPVAPPQPALSKIAAALVAPSTASDWYDTSNRETVRSAFNSVYVPGTGTPLGYAVGDTSAAYKDAVLRRINFYRAMAGVPSISSLDPVRNAKAQKGAVMIYANHALSHTPPGAWLQYTPEGAEALGKSNICQGLVEDPG